MHVVLADVNAEGVATAADRLAAHPGAAMYTAAKYAVVGLSETLAHDLRAEGAPVGVSVLCPGATASSLRENSAGLRPGGARGRAIPVLAGRTPMSAAVVAGLVV